MISRFFMFINFFKLLIASVFLCFVSMHAKLAQAEVVGDIEAGKNKISMCVGCHGIPDYKTAFPKTYRVPKIAGQRSETDFKLPPILVMILIYHAGSRLKTHLPLCSALLPHS